MQRYGVFAKEIEGANAVGRSKPIGRVEIVKQAMSLCQSTTEHGDAVFLSRGKDGGGTVRIGGDGRWKGTTRHSVSVTQRLVFGSQMLVAQLISSVVQRRPNLVLAG